jgi:transposase-like protein
MVNYSKFLERGLKNLRHSVDGLSLDKFIARSIEVLMLIEREEYLEKVGDEDKGNGFYERLYETFHNNKLIVEVPRTRSGDFKPVTLELTRLDNRYRNKLCLLLYQKGMTSRDISDVTEEMFGDGISHTKVSELAEVFGKFRKAWEKTKLNKYYKVVYVDGIHITVKRGDSYSDETVYIGYGVTEENKRELVILDVYPEEGAKVWGELLEGLKERGVENVDLLVADGIQGLEKELARVYPNSKLQKCVVHKKRNILNKVRNCDKAEIAEDLKRVFDNFDEQSSVYKAKVKIENFIDKWKKKYPRIGRYFNGQTIDYYLTYINYPVEVRRMIYTNNGIERVNRVIRKGTRNKLAFQKPSRLLDYVFIIVKKYEEKKWIYPIHQFSYW